jgi:hypothetical protein
MTKKKAFVSMLAIIVAALWVIAPSPTTSSPIHQKTYQDINNMGAPMITSPFLLPTDQLFNVFNHRQQLLKSFSELKRK